MAQNFSLLEALGKAAYNFHPVLKFDKTKDKLALLDLSVNNRELTPGVYDTTDSLAAYINEKGKQADATYLIGGYKEHREMYRRSNLFNKNISAESDLTEEPRSIHLGIDIWAPATTPVFAPLGGMVHSFAYNAGYGDYGATIILQHQIDMFNFYTLYGHLALKDLGNIRLGQFLTRGEQFAHFGNAEENGNWPPHLHFQVITDMLEYEGDFPGVCKPSETAKYFAICPDPDVILNMMRYLQA